MRQHYWILPSRNDSIILLARQHHNVSTIAARTKSTPEHVRRVLARAERFGFLIGGKEQPQPEALSNKEAKLRALIAARARGATYAEIACQFWLANAAQARNAVWRARHQLDGSQTR